WPMPPTSTSTRSTSVPEVARSSATSSMEASLGDAPRGAGSEIAGPAACQELQAPAPGSCHGEVAGGREDAEQEGARPEGLAPVPLQNGRGGERRDQESCPPGHLEHALVGAAQRRRREIGDDGRRDGRECD